MTMSDDDLGILLTETFAAYEHLADPDRAVAISATPAPPSHRGRVLLAAAAAVVVVAGGTTYAGSRGSGSTVPDAGPRTPHPTTTPGKPPLPPPKTDAENRAAAARAADDATADLPVFPGAHETDAAGAPGLDGQNVTISGSADYTVTRQRWWTVSGTSADTVAQWYDAHAPAGFQSEGVGGQGDGRTRVATVDYYRPNAPRLTTTGVSIEMQSIDTPQGVEIRAVVNSVWPPARQAASYVQDVTSIDASIVKTYLDEPSRNSRRSFTVNAPAQVLKIARVFDSLEGYPTFLHSCPLIPSFTSYRVVFHTATGDVTAHYVTSVCSSGMAVRRDGAVVRPTLSGGARLVAALGPAH